MVQFRCNCTKIAPPYLCMCTLNYVFLKPYVISRCHLCMFLVCHSVLISVWIGHAHNSGDIWARSVIRSAPGVPVVAEGEGVLMDQYLKDLGMEAAEDEHDVGGAGALSEAGDVAGDEGRVLKRPAHDVPTQVKKRAKASGGKVVLKRPSAATPTRKVQKKPAASRRDHANDHDDDDAGGHDEDDDDNDQNDTKVLRDRLKSRRFHQVWDSVPEYVKEAYTQAGPHKHTQRNPFCPHPDDLPAGQNTRGHLRIHFVVFCFCRRIIFCCASDDTPRGKEREGRLGEGAGECDREPVCPPRGGQARVFRRRALVRRVAGEGRDEVEEGKVRGRGRAM